MTDLCILAQKYGSDKCPAIGHTYTPEYHDILSSLRETTTAMLEIGIGNKPLMDGLVKNYVPGASLRMWRDYFPKATVSTCDILPDVLFQEDRINSYLCDQSNPESLLNMCNEIKNKSGIESFDLILDDGSHVTEHQTTSFRTLWRFLRPGGIYIIEDIFDRTVDHFIRLPHELKFNAEIIKVHRGTYYQDYFIAYRKLS